MSNENKKNLNNNESVNMYAEALNDVKTKFTTALEQFVNDGKKIISNMLQENGLDGDVVLVKNGQRGVLEIKECRRPLNGDFYVEFYPYKKDGSRYTTSTARHTLIPNENATLKVMLEQFEKAPDEPSANVEQTVM